MLLALRPASGHDFAFCEHLSRSNIGLKNGDEIVTGSYKVLRSLKNGANVKIDNSTPKKADEES